MLEFGRLITAVVTPFKDDGAVDYKAFGRLCEGLLDAGNDALVVTGTTGESPVLDEDERAALYREAVRVSRGKGKVIAGTGGYNTDESIHLSQMAAECGVDGLLQVAPYYNKPPQAGLIKHFTAIAEATPLPNILYNVPSRTVTNIDAGTAARLSEIDNIVGTKEASGDFNQIAEIVRTAADGFLVYSGNDSDTFHIMALGGVGIVSVAGHVVSREIRSMVDAFVGGDWESARDYHLRLLPLVRALFPAGWSNPIAVKAAINLSGFSVGVPRLPLVELPAEMQTKLKELLADYSLDPHLMTAAVPS